MTTLTKEYDIYAIIFRLITAVRRGQPGHPSITIGTRSLKTGEGEVTFQMSQPPERFTNDEHRRRFEKVQRWLAYLHRGGFPPFPETRRIGYTTFQDSPGVQTVTLQLKEKPYGILQTLLRDIAGPSREWELRDGRMEYVVKPIGLLDEPPEKKDARIVAALKNAKIKYNARARQRPPFGPGIPRVKSPARILAPAIQIRPLPVPAQRKTAPVPAATVQPEVHPDWESLIRPMLQATRNWSGVLDAGTGQIRLNLPGVGKLEDDNPIQVATGALTDAIKSVRGGSYDEKANVRILARLPPEHAREFVQAFNLAATDHPVSQVTIRGDENSQFGRRVQHFPAGKQGKRRIVHFEEV